MIQYQEIIRLIKEVQLTSINLISTKATKVGYFNFKNIQDLLLTLLYLDTNLRETLYYSIAEGLKNIIIEWKKKNFEELPKFCSIWVSYNSVLFGNKEKPKRIVPFVNGTARSYIYYNNNIEFSSDAIAYWFSNFLSNSSLMIKLQLSQNEFFPPSIHEYLVIKSSHGGNLPTAISISYISQNDTESIVLARNFNKVVFVRANKTNFVHLKKKLGNVFKEFENSDVWLDWYALFLKGVFEQFKNINHDGNVNTKLSNLLNQANAIIEQVNNNHNLKKHKVSTMCNIRIMAPGAETDYGSIIIFSDVVLSAFLIEAIQSLVWPIFLFLRQLEMHLIGEYNLYSHGLRAAIAAIMSRNASHNIGSHVLSRITTKGIDGWTEGIDVQKIVNELILREQIREIEENGKKQVKVEGEVWKTDQIEKTDLQERQAHVETFARDLVSWSKDVQFLSRYIQQRMDFIAQISTD